MTRVKCEHDWTYVEGGPYDAQEDAACYRDGFGYAPPGSEYVCKKCGKRKPAGDNVWDGDWREVLLMPLIFLGMIIIGAFGPFLMLIALGYEELASRIRASAARKAANTR